MNSEGNSNSTDEVQKMLENMYFDLVGLRAEHMKRKMAVNHKTDERELDGIKMLREKLEAMSEDYNSMSKDHITFLRLQKAAGKTNTKYSDEMLEKLKSITPNVGNINGKLPENKS